jgi:hypothetical protein
VPDSSHVITAQTVAAVEHDGERFVRAYRDRFGHVLNADNASELFDEYAASPETRALRVAAVRPAAAKVVELAYQELLAEPVRGALPLVAFISVGNGAGKSTSIGPDGPSTLVFDSTLSQFAPSVEHIERAVAAGFTVEVRHLVRDIEESWLAVLDRVMHQGRAHRHARLASNWATKPLGQGTRTSGTRAWVELSELFAR